MFDSPIANPTFLDNNCENEFETPANKHTNYNIYKDIRVRKENKLLDPANIRAPPYFVAFLYRRPRGSSQMFSEYGSRVVFDDKYSLKVGYKGMQSIWDDKMRRIRLKIEMCVKN